MYHEETDPGVTLRGKKNKLPELLRHDGRYQAKLGSTHDVWDVLYELVPDAEEDDCVREQVLEVVNERRLVIAHRFVSGRAVQFLFNRQLLRDELTELIEKTAA